MGAFTTISGQAFRAMQFSAGVLLRDFDPANPPAALTDSMILCATSGGVSAQCTPTYEDLGEDVDNCPKNTMELKKLIGWDCKLSFTALETTLEVLALALGAADSTTATGRVKPRSTLSTADFGTVWWVGDRFDGGFAAIRLDNALGGGFELQTTDKGKGQISVELTGHGSMSDPEAVPMAFYSLEGPSVDLSALVISGASLSPAFDPDTTVYTAATTAASGTVTATAADNSAAVTLRNGGAAVANGAAASWTTGENTLSITVTNGALQKVYTVTVTRGA